MAASAVTRIFETLIKPFRFALICADRFEWTRPLLRDDSGHVQLSLGCSVGMALSSPAVDSLGGIENGGRVQFLKEGRRVMAAVQDMPSMRDLDRRLDAMEKPLGDGLVPLWIFNDPVIHEAELDRVFGRNWIFMAHESEIPARGDYVLRTIGKDRFIVVRGDDGQVRVLFDSCRHHGASVCLTDKGSAKLFNLSFSWLEFQE